MIARVAFIGTNGGTSFSAKGFDAALNEIGHNTGNALFQYALWNRITNPKSCFAPGTDIAELRKRADLMLFPAANQVNPAWDLSAWADFVERADLPCAMIGLGAQTTLDGDANLELKEGTLRFIRAVASRTTRIGVRGDFTRRALGNLGVENTVVVGCPSQFINPRLNGSEIAKQIDRLRSMTRPNVGYVFGTMEQVARGVERHLSQLVNIHEHKIIFQTDPRLLRLVFLGYLEQDGDRDYLQWIGKVVRPDLSSNAYIEYLKKNGLFFSDARTWIDQMTRFDVVLGMRIHGTIAAIQAGKLGVCVAFDSRTLELAETMGYPHIRADDILSCNSLQDMPALIKFDATDFEEKRKGRRKIIDAILEENGFATTS